MIEIMNKNRTYQTSALYGITAFSDMLQSEFEDLRLQKNYAERMALRQANNAGSNEKLHRFRRDFTDANLPRKIDWRTQGALTPVNNQHECGACWAFSAIETIEAAHWLRTGELRPLSTQQMIDCARNGNNGCRGGDICTLFEWLVDNDVAIRPADDYPLHLRDEQCKKLTSVGNATTASESKTDVRVTNFVCMDMIGKEDDLLAGLARMGPVAVAVNAISWQNYLGGVIQHHCGSHPALMNHAVQIVGYDLEAEIPHYFVRNSWGEEFGHQGYLKIAIGGNLCGIVNEVAAVEVT